MVSAILTPSTCLINAHPFEPLTSDFRSGQSLINIKTIVVRGSFIGLRIACGASQCVRYLVSLLLQFTAPIPLVYYNSQCALFLQSLPPRL